MTQEQLNQIVDNLIIDNGIEEVVAAVANGALLLAERQDAMGHDSSEAVEIAQGLVELVSDVEEGPGEFVPMPMPNIQPGN